MQQVLVTGATSEIGRAVAVALRKAGYAVSATGRNQAALATLAAEAPGIETLCLDLFDRPAVAGALAGRRVDILINNAGVMPKPGSFDSMDFDAIDQTVEVNLQAVLFLTRLVLPQMRAARSGHLIFTGYSAAHAPGANFAVYAATKAAIAAFATSLRAEVSADEHGVTDWYGPGRDGALQGRSERRGPSGHVRGRRRTATFGRRRGRAGRPAIAAPCRCHPPGHHAHRGPFHLAEMRTK